MQFLKNYIKKLLLSKDPCIARCTECTIVQNGQVQYRGVSIKDNINRYLFLPHKNAFQLGIHYYYIKIIFFFRSRMKRDK